MKNPYDVDYLNGCIGSVESDTLEFKSSQDLLQEKARRRFMDVQIVPTVSAFLNSRGGKLVVGLEEHDNVVTGLSAGVPRKLYNHEQLASAICDRIAPSPADYVSVYSVRVGQDDDGDPLQAFVVDVRQGHTAYQASDKLYYVRNSTQSQAMADRDIRLRMLHGDKPRLGAQLQHRLVKGVGEYSRYLESVEWTLRLENVGVRTVRRALVRTSFEAQGVSDDSLRMIASFTPEYQRVTFPFEGQSHYGLMPGQRHDLSLIRVLSHALNNAADLTTTAVIAQVEVYIDDGLPERLKPVDLMSVLRPVVESGWTAPA